MSVYSLWFTDREKQNIKLKLIYDIGGLISKCITRVPIEGEILPVSIFRFSTSSRELINEKKIKKR